jgi:excisionase family DNA binding protein
MERVYTLQEVADLLKTGINYVQELRKSGLLKCIKIGHYKVTETTLKQFLAKYDGMDITDPHNPKELNA